MFIQKRSTVLIATVAMAATAALFSSCGGSKTGPTPEQQSAQAASARGFQTITTPDSELRPIANDLEDKNIPCAIGMGQSTDEGIARTTAADDARAKLAVSIDAQVQRMSESYAQNVDGEAKKIWEEGVRQITNQNIRGSRIIKEIAQFNPETNRYQIYVLIALDPSKFKAALEEATARDEELELRVKKDDMMSKMDAAIAEYDSKYKR
jgi:hypothetical protein